MLALLGGLLGCVGLCAQSPGARSSAPDLSEQMRAEQKHFLECLASIYSPAWWFTYGNSLYFQPQNPDQVQQLEAMKAARSKYWALTNRAVRYKLAARLIAESGVDTAWQQKLLLPFSATNQNLTPTLDKPLRVVPRYKVAHSFTNGDALLEDDGSTCFVIDWGRGTGEASGTNALLIKIGTKTYSSAGVFTTVDAFVNASLTAEEWAVLTRVAAAFQKEATILAQQIEGPKAREEFEACKARATDSNPYMQYLLAKAYLEGKGTERDEKLGMEWMTRAAKSGSGDAIAYLDALGCKAR